MVKCVLPPCHGLITQFYIRNNKYLDCTNYCRSQDIFLGTPFNIASYALLLHIISHMTKYRPGKLIINMGDTHIYKSHIDAVKKQLKRTPLQFPRLKILKKIEINNINELKYDDFKLIDYKYFSSIKAKMVI